MSRRLTLSGDALIEMMAVAHRLGGGQDLGDILQIIARTVTEVIGFDAVAVNVRRDDDSLEVRAVVGPPEVEDLRGGRMSESQWHTLLQSCERWGGLYFSRIPELPVDVPTADPWHERLIDESGPLGDPPTPGFLPSEQWRAEFALLAPVWSDGVDGNRLQGVISVDLPRSGYTPNPEQQMLLELFASQVGTAIDRVSEAEYASDRISLYRAAFVESPLATAMVDATMTLSDVNDAFLQLVDAVPGELDGRQLADFFDVDAAEFTESLQQLQPGQTATAAHECRLHHPRGLEWDRWVDVTARRVDSIHDDPRYVCTLTDRTAARTEMAAIRHRAEHDALTGLSTRPVWLGDLQARMSVGGTSSPSAQDGGLIGVLFCDLDGFKKVNDTSGHSAGDGVLVAVADILRTVTVPDDAVCRWGGDEFAVVASRGSIAALKELATAIATAVADWSSSAELGSPVTEVTISIGVAVVRIADHSATTTEITEVADTALYRAKGSSGERIHLAVMSEQ